MSLPVYSSHLPRAGAVLALLTVSALGPVPVAWAHNGNHPAATPPAQAVAATRPVRQAPLRRTEARYTLPAVPLMRQDGEMIGTRQALDDGRPVLLNFVFTTCNTICPVTSQVFAEVRSRLGEDRERLHMVSISIDAEYDIVDRLRAYSDSLGAGAGWSFFTGTEADSIAVQKAFHAYQGDKMNHVPVTFLRAAPGQPWIRLEGLASPAQLLAEVRGLLPMRSARLR